MTKIDVCRRCLNSSLNSLDLVGVQCPSCPQKGEEFLFRVGVDDDETKIFVFIWVLRLLIH